MSPPYIFLPGIVERIFVELIFGVVSIIVVLFSRKIYVEES